MSVRVVIAHGPGDPAWVEEARERVARRRAKDGPGTDSGRFH